MNHVSNPNEPYPSTDDLAAATTSRTQGHFCISTRKLPISKSTTIDAMSSAIGMPLPEMLFGDNMVQVRHQPTGWTLRFNTRDALNAVDKTDRNVLKVAYARDWERSREEAAQQVKDAVKPYDWSYSTTYAGTLEQPKDFCLRPSERSLPMELLKRQDPILLYNEVVLYESELDDNGISLYSAKVRVHPERMLLLCRLFMRLDNVVVRIRDTRVYIEFSTDEVIREYTAKEAPFEEVKKALSQSGPDDVTAALRDPNVLDPLLSVIEQRVEEVTLQTL